MTDRDGNIEYVNPTFTKVTGYSAEEAKGQNPRILKSGNTSQEVYANLWETVMSGGAWKGEFINKKKDGSTYWASATISGIKDASGKIVNLIGIQEDITARKKGEGETKKFNEMAVNRELKMIELKKEVNELNERLGEKRKYKEQ
jgi:PAS domain S-box-containing protein